MYRFRQSTGELFAADGSLVGVGWAGQGDGRNNPDWQNVPKTGPLPRGMYTIEKPAYHHPKLGPVVMDLVPDPDNEMFGRSLFRIHGAAFVNPAESSEGCIIMRRSVRELIDASEDNSLQVEV